MSQEQQAPCLINITRKKKLYTIYSTTGENITIHTTLLYTLPLLLSSNEKFYL